MCGGDCPSSEHGWVMNELVGTNQGAVGDQLSPTEEDIPFLIEGIFSFVRKVIEPLETEHAAVLTNPRVTYRDDGVPTPEYKEIRRSARVAAAKAGYYALFAPEAVGGGGVGATGMLLIYEALYREFGPGRALLGDVTGQWNRGPSSILSMFSPSLRATIAPRLMAGEEIFCFGLSEPDSGSDAWAMKTRAERVDGGWRINGTKQWISDSPYADYVLVFAVTDAEARDAHRGGISAFLVPMAQAGVELASAIRLFGEIGGMRGILTFDDVEVSDDDLVGVPGKALAIATAGVSLGRIYNAGRAVGTSRWALALAAEYANTRKTFGQTIGNYQAIQFMLADSMMEAYAAHTMALDCARKIDAGDRSAKRLAMVKAYACERSFEILDRCMQVHGGMGFVNETRLYAGWTQARVSRVADGSSEIMRRNIARAILRGDLEF
jgi:acyl-CoA dehydrogenase